MKDCLKLPMNETAIEKIEILQKNSGINKEKIVTKFYPVSTNYTKDFIPSKEVGTFSQLQKNLSTEDEFYTRHQYPVVNDDANTDLRFLITPEIPSNSEKYFRAVLFLIHKGTPQHKDNHKIMHINKNDFYDALGFKRAQNGRIDGRDKNRAKKALKMLSDASYEVYNNNGYLERGLKFLASFDWQSGQNDFAIEVSSRFLPRKNEKGQLVETYYQNLDHFFLATNSDIVTNKPSLATRLYRYIESQQQPGNHQIEESFFFKKIGLANSKKNNNYARDKKKVESLLNKWKEQSIIKNWETNYNAYDQIIYTFTSFKDKKQLNMILHHKKKKNHQFS